MRRHASGVVASGFSQKTGLPAASRGEDVLLVRLAPGADDHRVHAVGGDQLLAGAEDLRVPQPGRDRAGPLDVDVGHRDDVHPGQHPGQPADVVLADHADPDDAHPDGHTGLPSAVPTVPIPTPRR